MADTPPRPEHPDPSRVRNAWLTLNGPWDFAFDPQNEGEQRRWWAGRASEQRGPFQRRIVVPFPWESPLSGIAEPGYRGIGWYRRQVTVPADWREQGLRPVLHFGAVDWQARVWVDGRLAVEHSGGYDPFEVDLAPLIQDATDRPLTVVVRVRDDREAATLLGKQTINWYTASSGIWQPVWLEGRPASYVACAPLTPSLHDGRLNTRPVLQIAEAGQYTVTLRSPQSLFPPVEQTLTLAPGRHEAHLAVSIPNARAWSPVDPFLYHVEVELRGPNGPADVLRTYAGMRDVAIGRWDGRDYEYVLLNGEPVYLRGALDQAFHPDGVHTYPSDDAIRTDVQAAKDAGLNMLRCHIKLNDPRYYYWADTLGVLIMQDIPNPMIATPASRAAWQDCLRAAIARDSNHPAIVAWVLFNETWGLSEHRTPESWRWLAEQVALAKALDPTRLVEDNSACNYDHIVSELNSWHFYIPNWEAARRHVQTVVDRTYPGSPFNYVAGLSDRPEAREYVQHGLPLLNSEYAGVSASSGDRDISQSLKFLTTDLRRHDKVCGYVYTELTDVEWEHNGLLEYDRSPKTFGYDAFVPGMTTADLLSADVIGLDAPPCQTLPPGATFSAPAFVSHWSKRDLTGARLKWRAEVVDRFGEQYVWRDGELPVTLCRYGVTDAGILSLRLPPEPGLLTLALWLEAADGAIVARNYVNVEVWAQPSARIERTASGWALRTSPADTIATTWPIPRILPNGGKAAFGGRGSVDYRFPWPEGLDPATVRGLRLKLELGTRAAQERRTSWGRYQTTDYPQTEPNRQRPGDVAISLNGTVLAQRRLADDPNDARGILTFQQAVGDDSSYGELVEVAVPEAELARIVAVARQQGAFLLRLEVPANGLARGLSIYGERMGAYPLDPTLLVDIQS